ncbi:MAG: hypothetical protein HY898_11630 [Deltaproteobacteria bacterium]|nr:hypothetical protein [Deltaproteobacteria bacterium]
MGNRFITSLFGHLGCAALTAALASAAGCGSDSTSSGAAGSPQTGGSGGAAGSAGTAGTAGKGGTGGSSGCKADGECKAPTAKCDTTTGKCVQCLPASDNCSKGKYCAAATMTCVDGCKSNDDCPASTPPLTCDVSTHACVGCNGSDDKCPAGQVCQADKCVAGCTAKHACPSPKQCCNGQCEDTTTTEHCGSCQPCASPLHTVTACVAGACSVESCDTGFADCNALASDGCEIDTNATAEHCGGCTTKCDLPHAFAKCDAGTCGVSSCETGWGDCNADPSDGCESNLAIEVANCGTCGNVCVAQPGAAPTCAAGACVPGTCLSGFVDCNADPTDGCEVDTLGDPDHCGGCSVVCPSVANGARACSQGVCAVGACNAGWGDCDGSLWTGCETDTLIDTDHCGTCGFVCPVPPGQQPSCAQGMCGGGQCNPGKANCDGNASNGCEVSLADDVANCGACNNACPAIVHATASCTGFLCGLGACDAGWGDCSGGTVDGCETDLNTSVDHCGSCTTVCPAVANGSRACDAALCKVGACAAGFSDCNQTVSDGCEVNTKTDALNCSACGQVCPTPANGVAACTNGVCGLGTCNAGFANCDGDATNGCEFATQTDPNNCGGCGVKCFSGTCANAQCTCLKTVLILKDDSDSGSQALGNAIQAAGYTVTYSAAPAYQYTGANPALSGFGAVVVLAGGPSGQPSVTTDMPVAGQTALVNYVSAGGGLVLTEWAAYHVASGRWQTLKPLVLLSRNVAYAGQVTYTVDAPYATHPIWAGLPSSFTFASTSNVGMAVTGPGIHRIAGSPQSVDAVVIRDLPVGRVAEIAHAGNYAPNGWTNTNIQKLVTNSVGWVARCQ